MKKISIFLSICLAYGLATAQEQADRYTEITDAKLVHINRLQPRSTFYTFNSLKDAMNAPFS
ncbi:hypothetical protein, partial [Petrimonas mucosa]